MAVMERSPAWHQVITVIALALSLSAAKASFQNFRITFGEIHSSVTPYVASLVLDQDSGTGIQSNKPYLFGSFEMLIKLVPGNSAGTVVAYYLSSKGDAHDEIDFEFLGNVSGQPYVIHTNIFAQGIGGREQQFFPWFDPTNGYHNYTIHWNPSTVVWYVDSVPIRVYRKYPGIGYPEYQGMSVYSSLWNADNWATRGGKDKIDWQRAPFIANLNRFRARACVYGGLSSIRWCARRGGNHWWTSPAYRQLSGSDFWKMTQLRAKYMIYDYCKDFKRFRTKPMPPECSKPQY